jgi:hypothetical protein
MLDAPLTESVIGAMATYLARAKPTGTHRNRYDPAEFGL